MELIEFIAFCHENFATSEVHSVECKCARRLADCNLYGGTLLAAKRVRLLESSSNFKIILHYIYISKKENEFFLEDWFLGSYSLKTNDYKIILEQPGERVISGSDINAKQSTAGSRLIATKGKRTETNNDRNRL